ncbi:Cytochrome c oxidase assembly protein cox19 [Rhizoclosmatium hyalinum]|nr:Cytochrome c oxidase assembly protein cox19 [Rhizoclosmatium hyalinum]
MSMGNSFQRTSIKAIPPERGAFPLDLEGLCKEPFKAYMECMHKQKGGEHKACRDLSKAYIQCRMNTKLMEPDSFENIGFGDKKSSPLISKADAASEKSKPAESSTS